MNKEFLISEHYRLELHWRSVKYKEDQIAILDGCYFDGPVLREVWQLNQKDYIDLDFAAQYTIFIESYYVSRLSWQGVNHISDKILLSNVRLKNINLNVVPKLNSDDYIVIDTQEHEDYKHRYNLVYPSYLLRQDGILYNFSEMS